MDQVNNDLNLPSLSSQNSNSDSSLILNAQNATIGQSNLSTVRILAIENLPSDEILTAEGDLNELSTIELSDLSIIEASDQIPKEIEVDPAIVQSNSPGR